MKPAARSAELVQGKAGRQAAHAQALPGWQDVWVKGDTRASAQSRRHIFVCFLLPEICVSPAGFPIWPSRGGAQDTSLHAGSLGSVVTQTLGYFKFSPF